MNLRDKFEKAYIIISLDLLVIEENIIRYEGKTIKNRFEENGFIKETCDKYNLIDETLALLQGDLNIELTTVKKDLQKKLNCDNIIVISTHGWKVYR